MQRLKNVDPPFNTDLLMYDAEAGIFYFGRRVKDQGADLLLMCESYPAAFDAPVRPYVRPLADFTAANGAVVYWRMLFKPRCLLGKNI